MDRRRSVMMAGGVVVAALAIGQLMQSGTAESSVTMYPTGSSQPQPQPEPKPEPLRLAAGTPLAPEQGVPEPVPVRLDVEHATTAPKDPMPSVVKADVCAPMLDVFADDAANLSITLTAPCHPNQTVVLQHAGLAVTFQTTATGALFASIPGLQPDGALSIRFPDGSQIAAQAAMPELAGIRRIAVQWMDADTFALRSDSPAIRVGTVSGPLPMLAEVVTLTDAPATPLSIEAEVTPETCGRELLGEVLISDHGVVTREDLSLAMPECDGMGGFVALNNPLAETKLAQAD